MTFEAEVEPQAEQQREPLLEPLIPKEKCETLTMDFDSLVAEKVD